MSYFLFFARPRRTKCIIFNRSPDRSRQRFGAASAAWREAELMRVTINQLWATTRGEDSLPPKVVGSRLLGRDKMRQQPGLLIANNIRRSVRQIMLLAGFPDIGIA